MAFTTQATTVAGRNGHVRSKDGVIDLDLSLPRLDGTPETTDKTNPEALFAAAYSACFGQAILAAANLEKIRPEQVSVTALVTLEVDGSDFDVSVVLRSSIEGVERGQAEQLVHKAHTLCPYSKATRNNIPVKLEIL